MRTMSHTESHSQSMTRKDILDLMESIEQESERDIEEERRKLLEMMWEDREERRKWRERGDTYILR